MKTWDLDRFDGGLDLRKGMFSREQNRFRLARNVVITAGESVARRPPCVDLGDGGTFDAQTQGLIEIDGQKYTFAPKGATITHTGDVATEVQTLYFDVPDTCEAGWTLVRAAVIDGYAVAWIRHDFPSATYPNLLFLHVWDELVYAPTFCQDPYLAGSFSPSILDVGESQIYSDDFTPALGLGASRLWTPTLAGNTLGSRTADPRVWNVRTLDAFKEDGEIYAFVIPEGAGNLYDLIIPRPYDDLKGLDTWTYTTLERASGSSWVTMNESASVATPGADQYSVTNQASRFAGGPDEIRIRLRWNQVEAGIVRYRMVAGATAVEVVQAPTVAPETYGDQYAVRFGPAVYRYRSGEEVTVPAYWMPLIGIDEILVKVRESEDQVQVTSDLVERPLSHLAEKERITHRIRVPARAGSSETMIRHARWRSGAWTAGTGTVTSTIYFTTLAGAGTAFNTEVEIGMTIRINGTDVNTVVEMDTDTSLTELGTPWPASRIAVAWERDIGSYSIFQDGKTKICIGTITGDDYEVGDYLTINAIEYQVAEVESYVYTQTSSTTVLGVILVLHKNGEHGNWTADLASGYAVDSTFKPVVTTWEYAYEQADSDWYNALVLEYTDLAGQGDAILINTSAQDNTGGQITSIHAVKRRMLITFAGSTQLWEIDEATAATRWLETVNLGTGDQVWPSPVNFYGAIVLPTEQRWEAFSVVGNLLDSLNTSDLSQALEGLRMPTVRAAAFWPDQKLLVIATEDATAGTIFYVLSYAKESKLTAWQEWVVAGGMTIAPETLIATRSTLFFRTEDHRLLGFDAASTIFADLDEDEDEEFESDILFKYNDFGMPGRGKTYHGFDLVQEGECTVAFQVIPFGASDELPAVETNPIRVAGQTYGFPRRGMSLNAPAIAPRLRSRSRTGWKLHRIAIHYREHRR